MESEKKTKSFRSQPVPTDLEAEFKPFLPAEGFAKLEMKGVQQVVHDDDAFGLPTDFWGWINSDASLRREFDKHIEIKAQERAEKIHDDLRQKVTEEGHKKGFEAGFSEAKRETEVVTRRLNDICNQIINEKQALLESHEKVWLQTFSHLLKRFLIPKNELILEQLQTYLIQSVATYSANTKLKIHLAAEDYAHFAPVIEKLEHGNWLVISDVNLKTGEIHCEMEDGGIFFSANDEYKKLEQWIEQQFPSGDKV